VRIEVRVDGERAGDKVVPCAEKGEAELVDCAIDGIPSILAHVPTREVPPEPTPPTKDAPPPPSTAPEHVPRIRGLGIAGIVVAAGGLATTIAGAVYMARGEVTDPTLVGRNETTDFRVPGRVLLGVGVAALVVGTVMIAADAGVQAKKRKQARARIELDAGPGFAGARLRGRF
jgi:hypothetical protein